MSVSPCVYPMCRDADGNPHLTEDVICDRSRNHYRRLLDWLVQDFVQIQTDMPTPIRGSGWSLPEKIAAEYGHPAEWASDTLRDIAQALNWAEEGLREYLGHEPAPHQHRPDVRLLRHGYGYLTKWFNDLCTYPAAGDTAAELYELHGKIRHTLGHTRPTMHLPVPCPECELRTLFRTVDKASPDQVDCRNCGLVIPETHYHHYARVLLEEFVA